MGALRVLPDPNITKNSIDPFCDTAVAVPSSLLKNLLEFYHAGLGHTGLDRMEDSLRLKWWFPTMREHCRNHVNGCLLCKLRKTDKLQGKIPTRRYAISVRPFQRVHMDLAGPFQETEGTGYKYILTAKCPLTQWVEVIPLRSKSTLEVTQAITDKILCVHGSLETVITDNGTEFIGNIANAVHYLLNNEHKRVTPYRPSANGEIENLNGTIKDMLTSYCADNHTIWDRFLPIIVHAYRTTVNTATGFSPFRAVFGREARQPAEHWIEDF